MGIAVSGLRRPPRPGARRAAAPTATRRRADAPDAARRGRRRGAVRPGRLERDGAPGRRRPPARGGIPHGWEGTTLQVAAEDEAPVENMLDIVEGGPTRGARAARRGPRPGRLRHVGVGGRPAQRLADALAAAGDRLRVGATTSCSSTPTTRSGRRAVRQGRPPRPARGRGRRRRRRRRRAAGRRSSWPPTGCSTTARTPSGTIAAARHAPSRRRRRRRPTAWTRASGSTCARGRPRSSELLADDTVDRRRGEAPARDLRTVLRPFV